MWEFGVGLGVGVGVGVGLGVGVDFGMGVGLGVGLGEGVDVTVVLFRVRGGVVGVGAGREDVSTVALGMADGVVERGDGSEGGVGASGGSDRSVCDRLFWKRSNQRSAPLLWVDSAGWGLGGVDSRVDAGSTSARGVGSVDGVAVLSVATSAGLGWGLGGELGLGVEVGIDSGWLAGCEGGGDGRRLRRRSSQLRTPCF